MLAITRSPTSFLSPWCTSRSWSSVEVDTCCSYLFVSGVSCGECWIPLQIPVESAFVLVCRAGVFVFWFAQACPAELELVLFLRLGCASPSSRCPGYLPFVPSTTALQAIHFFNRLGKKMNRMYLYSIRLWHAWFSCGGPEGGKH